MELASTRIVSAAPAEVWRALNDVDCLRASIPGCEAFERTAENAYNARVTARIGPVVATFSGQVAMLDIDAPHGYTMHFEGQGGAAGFANGDAKVTLAPADGGATALSYTVHAQVGGKLAQIGSRLIDGVAAKLADEFFARFASQFVTPEASAESSGMSAPATDTSVPIPAGFEQVATSTSAASALSLPARGGSPWTRYIAIAAIVALMAILYFTGGHFR